MPRCECTWNECTLVSVETLQGGGPPTTPEDIQLLATLLECPHLHVQQYTCRVLEALQVLLLLLPDVAHAVMVHQTQSCGVRQVPHGFQEPGNHAPHLLHSTRSPPAVPLQFPWADGCKELFLSWGVSTVAVPPLPSLGLLQALHIRLVPFENAGGNLGTKGAIERVVLRSEAAVKAPHEVPAVQPHCRLPRVKQLCHRRHTCEKQPFIIT